jgi:autotransporter strand-loop-strand O-heptosyltransferase
MKLLIVTPHLSTGGSCRYLVDYLTHNKDKFSSIKLVEFSSFSPDYVVHKNILTNMLGADNLFCLGGVFDSEELFIESRNELLKIMKTYEPEIVWFNESPEGFEYRLPPKELMEKIYDTNRKYKIIETTHSNSFDFDCKKFIPDEFMFCSDIHLKQSSSIHVKKTVWEVPISELQRPDRSETLKSLGLDPSYIHVLNVAIFNENKNQKYIFELADTLEFYKIKFHFLGNLCFKNDCGIPEKMLSLPNCKIWGERGDTSVFMSCMDAFLFPSHRELNPLSVKEALSWGMDVYCKYCETYSDKYKGLNNFKTLENCDIKKDLIEKIIKLSDSCEDEGPFLRPDPNPPSGISENWTKPGTEPTKFAIFTSFFNSEKYIDSIFELVSRIKYVNFSWFITDDFSSDGTKNKLLKAMARYPLVNIIFLEQSFKKQLYWIHNEFIPEEYEYIVTIDADDIFDVGSLEVYNHFIKKDPSTFLLTCDFKKIQENSGKLHSFSLVDRKRSIIEKLSDYHPSVDYSRNLNYSLFGMMKCVKNDKNLKYIIEDFDACAEDSYRVLFANSRGKWVHVPRNLYTWNFREDSESHGQVKNNFNGNFDVALNECSKSEVLNDPTFYPIYLETCALQFLDSENKKKISIFSKTNRFDILEDLFFDKEISLNSYGNYDTFVIVANYYSEQEIVDILKKISDIGVVAEVVVYRLEIENLEASQCDGLTQSRISKKGCLSLIEGNTRFCKWFDYFRHLFVEANSRDIKIQKTLETIGRESKAAFDSKADNKKKIKIVSNGTLGDCVAWMSAVEKFKKEKGCSVDYFSKFKTLFEKEYPDINFFDRSEADRSLEVYEKTYLIECLDEDQKSWRGRSMHQIVGDALGSEESKEKPRIHKANINRGRKIPGKYVCIAIQSTAQCKYWNNKTGWGEVTTYLNGLGYKVVCVDQYSSFGVDGHMNLRPEKSIDMTGMDLDDTTNLIYFSDFFIGLSSGLSWLAWALNKKVVMISGFSENFYEFETPYRVRNDDVCHGCWNDTSVNFDRSWLWCPRKKNFECHSEITFDMVKAQIDKCVSRK